MSSPATAVAALAATLTSAVVLATVHIWWTDIAAGAVLVISLALLVRAAIRLASDPAGADDGWS